MKKALVLILLATGTASYSQVPYTLLKDQAPNTSNSTGTSNGGMTNASGDGIAYFAAETPLTGLELWKTDGTKEGTVFVKDVKPGPDSSYPQAMQVINNILFFKTNAGDLWMSDGTTEGTFSISESGDIMGVADNIVFFNDRAKLLATDGTRAGTVVLKNGDFNYFGSANGKGYLLSANYDQNGKRELLSSDGTVAGTNTVNLFATQGAYTGITIGDRIYTAAFNAYDDGSELWYFDTISETFVRVIDIIPNNRDGVTLIGALGGKILFNFVDQNSQKHLYVSDGTESGTIKLADVEAYHDYRQPMVIANNQYYFSGYTSDTGAELWKTDGTIAGTHMVKEFIAGPTSSEPEFPTAFKGKLYFTALSDNGLRYMWMTDGTTAGTTLLDGGGNNIEVIAQGPMIAGTNKLFFYRGYRLWVSNGTFNSSVDLGAEINTFNEIPLNGGMMFNATGNVYFADGTPNNIDKIYGNRIDPSIAWGYENWVPVSDESNMSAVVNDKLYLIEDNKLLKTDGTPEGTSVVQSFAVGVSTRMIELNDKLIFPGYLGELWVSDGTSAMTLLKDLQPDGSGDVAFLKKFNGHAYYTMRRTSSAPYETRLWSTDGTVAGTVRLDLSSTELFGVSAFLGEAGDDLLIGLRDQSNHLQVWKTNGTPEGTSLVKTLDTNITDNINVHASNGIITYFAVTTGYYFELWRSDGTTDGTYKVKNIRTGTASTSFQYIMFNLIDNILYFGANDGTHGNELWRSDGTEAGTYMVKDIIDGVGDGQAIPLQGPAVNGYFLLTALNAASDVVLYKSDGTDANTTLLKNFGRPPEVYWPIWELNGVFYFIGWDADHGQEMWKSDGTPGGTVMIKDIMPGKGSSLIRSVKKIGSSIYFVAHDGDHGFEIWKTDGTACGTGMLTDDEASVYFTFTSIGDKLVFPAYSTELGSEFFAYDLSLTPPGCKTPQTITFSPVDEKHWGDASFALAASSSSGLPVTYASSNNTKLSLDGSNAVIKGTGTVIITATQKGNNTFAAAPQVSITIKITKGLVIATAHEISRSYGDANPELTISYEGFVGGDTKLSLDEQPKATTTATETSDAGDYIINVTGGSDDHYELEYVNNSLHVEKANLSVTANTEDVPYNQEIPALQYVVEGLKEFDSVDELDSPIVITTTATKGSNVGEYPITLEAMTDNNYDIEVGNAVLKIYKAEQTITFPIPESMLVGESVDLTATSSSGLPISFIKATDNITITGNTVTGTTPGLARVHARQTGNANYLEAQEKDQELCVNPLPPVLTYNETDQTITSNESIDHVWFKDGVLIEGETSSSLEVTQNGVYRAVATATGNCWSEFSAELSVFITGIKDEIDVVDVIYPSPAKDFVYVKTRSSASTPSFNWTTSDGKSLALKNKIENDNGFSVIKFDLTDLPAGMYLLKVNSSVKKIMKIH